MKLEPWPDLPAMPAQLTRFRAGEIAYLRVKIVGSAEGVNGESSVSVLVVDKLLKTEEAVYHYVKETDLISRYEVRKALAT